MIRASVRLSWAEILFASHVGIVRQVQNLKERRQDRYGADAADGWGLHIEGACGELAVAKHLGLFWSGSIGNLKADDVGPIQVRRRTKVEWDHIIHPSDPDDRAFVLVTGALPTLFVCGWIMGRDAKQERWWSDPSGKNRHAFFVPQSELRDTAELRS